LESSKRKGGGRNLTELDVFEITATSVPMNNETRVLSHKQATDAEDQDEPPDQLLANMLEEAADVLDAETDPEDLSAMRDIISALQDLLGTEAGETDETGKALRSRRVQPGAGWLIPESELAGAGAGELKATWTTAYINSLPDSCFLYIAPGGEKDSEGKTTPRSLRYFPVKNADGSVDLAHVRNALSRIPQANVPQSVKDRAMASARRMLNASKAVEVASPKRAADPLRARADTLVLDYMTDGESRRKPPPDKVTARPRPALALDELRRRTRDETLKALAGVDET
jgi:hypothetical protein